jgi:hypothetical protein
MKKALYVLPLLALACAVSAVYAAGQFDLENIKAVDIKMTQPNPESKLSIRSAPRSDTRESRPVYELRGLSTQLGDFDVNYWSLPILLVRTAAANAVHWIEFNVSLYEQYCAYFENRCVQYDNNGQCIRWERVCAQWNLREYQVGKRLDINFRNAAPLAGDQQETFELTINRQKPFDQGEDSVRTWLKEENVLKPVHIMKIGEYQYDVRIK